MTVEEIIKSYLKENGYDGLCNQAIECGCGIDALGPCNGPWDECEPAYKTTCGGCADADYCFTTDYRRKCWKGGTEE